MTTQRARFEAYYRLPGAKHPECQAAVLAAADAYDAAAAAGRISAGQLRVLVAAASDPRSRVWANCYDLLAAAAGRWPEAAEAIVTMSRDPKAHVRFNALCCLDRQTPPGVVDHVLRGGLTDRSARVRWNAADRADQLERRELIPDLTAAVAAERNANARKSMDFALGFLRDGYTLRTESDGSVWIAVRLSNGGTGHKVSREELAARGVDAIVAEVRGRHESRPAGGPS